MSTPETTSSHDISKEFVEFTAHIRKIMDLSQIRVAADVGSRDGIVALRLKQLLPQARVYAFECNPAGIELIRKNLAGAPEVVLIEKAVADTDGTLTFYPIDPQRTTTPHADGNIGASSLFRANPEYPYEQYVQAEVTVPSTRLDTWAREQRIPAIDLIWMDLQGAELMALKGLGSLLSSVKIIYTEVAYKPVYQGQPLVHEITEFLKAEGFTMVARLEDGDWFGNHLFCRSTLLPWWRRLARLL